MDNECCEDRVGGSVNVTDELNALLTVYTNAESDMLKREDSSLKVLDYYMKVYLDCKHERMGITDKLNALRHKLGVNEQEGNG